MRELRNILAPTDLSDSNLPALRYARLLAVKFAAKVTVMYTDPIVYPVDLAVPSETFRITASPEHQARLRAEVERHAAPEMKGIPFDIDITVGMPVPVILAAARDTHADLIILGTHLRHGWRRALLGSVSDGVIHGSACPVLTVAAHERYTSAVSYEIAHVMCPINFTDVSREALRFAADTARAFGAHLTVVRVLEPHEAGDEATEEDRVREWVEPELRDLYSFRQVVTRGGPAERVLDCADDLAADLLVVGAQHKIFRDATVIGTTTERLIRFASCPVAIVPREVTTAGAAVMAEGERESFSG